MGTRVVNVLKEFREFAVRGNVIDLAVGIVVGAAFNRIVSSFVDDVLTPPIGLLLGKVNFSDLYVELSSQPYAPQTLAGARAAGVPTLNYGNFLQHLIDFTIVAFVIFLIVRAINRMRRPAEEPREAAEVKQCPYCFSTIAIRATRCPNCTSEVPALEAAPGPA